MSFELGLYTLVTHQPGETPKAAQDKCAHEQDPSPAFHATSILDVSLLKSGNCIFFLPPKTPSLVGWDINRSALAIHSRSIQSFVWPTQVTVPENNPWYLKFGGLPSKTHEPTNPLFLRTFRWKPSGIKGRIATHLATNNTPSLFIYLKYWLSISILKMVILRCCLRWNETMSR